MNNKIPCSIGILTLNSAKSLESCLSSVKEFSEIVICDGNSTDNTLEIAKKYRAKIIKQYDSDELNLTCQKDKANVRQKNMEAASYDWYFFMDSDDTLSKEVISEIREIVTNPNPEFLIYRMPTRIFIEGKEIKYEAAYPAYQIRLVNRRINPYFKGRVHDRIIFDKKKYKLGELRGFYNFHWSKERTKNYWQYLRKYIQWEIEVAEFSSFIAFLYWGIYKRARTIAGYLLYRIPKIYILHGFKDSMPMKIEFLIVLYHINLLFGIIKKQIFGARPFIFLKEIFRKKDISRILTNILLKNKECFGKILDIGSGREKASHYRFLKLIRWTRRKTVDIDPNKKPDLVLDIEKDQIPIPENSYNYVFAFNILEHLANRNNLLKEVYRILKSNGELIGSVPFLVNIHPDPHDYLRLTKEQLEAEFKLTGFKSWEIIPIGFGPFIAAYSQIEFLIPRFFRLIIIPITFLLDVTVQIIKPLINFKERYPLAYVFYVTK